MLARWNPFRELTGLQNEMNRLFDGFNKKLAPAGTAMAWNPTADVYEDEGNFVVKAELPGLTKDDIELHMEGRTLTLKGERKMEKEVKEEAYHQVERSYGRFLRVFTFPSPVDEGKVNAKFKDGLLEVVVPKSQETKPKTIPVAGA